MDNIIFILKDTVVNISQLINISFKMFIIIFL